MRKVDITLILVLFVKIVLSQEFTLRTQYEEYFTKNSSTLESIEGFWIDNDNDNTYSIKKIPPFTGIMKERLRQSWRDKNYFDSIMNSNSMLFYEFVLVQDGFSIRNSIKGLTAVKGSDSYRFTDHINNNLVSKDLGLGLLKTNDLFLLFIDDDQVVLRKIYPLKISNPPEYNDDLEKETGSKGIKEFFSDFDYKKYKEAILAILTLSFIWAIYFATKKIQKKLKTKNEPDKIKIEDKREFIDLEELLIEENPIIKTGNFDDKPQKIQEQKILVNPESHKANRWLRLFNFLIDSILINTLFAYCVGYILARLGFTSNLITEHIYLFTISLMFFFYFIQEYFWGVTIGKLITRTYVVNSHGNKPTALEILARTALRLIPFEAFSFLGSGERGWHDTISGTYVIKLNIRSKKSA